MISNSHKDIQSYIDSVPYGAVTFTVVRVNRHTTEVITHGSETLKYTDTEAALADVTNILSNLAKTGYSGNAHIECTYKDGDINLVTIHDSKQTKY